MGIPLPLQSCFWLFKRTSDRIVEVRSADGSSYRAHGLVLMAGSDYFCAAYTGGWADARTPHVRVAVFSE